MAQAGGQSARGGVELVGFSDADGVPADGYAWLGPIMVAWGHGAPNLPNAPSGSLYLRRDGAGGSTLYVNENGSWVGK